MKDKYTLKRLVLMVVIALFGLSIVPAFAQDDDGQDEDDQITQTTDGFLRINEESSRVAERVAVESAESAARVSGDVDYDEAFSLREQVVDPNAGLITVYVKLEGESAISRAGAFNDPLSASAVQAVNSAGAQVSSVQQRFASQLSSQFNAQLLGRVQYTGNALVMNVDASQVEAMRELPGIEYVIPDQIGQLTHENSVPLVGAPSAWEYVGGGLTGSGIRIGIIDSGVDYTHANFGGSGDPSRHDDSQTADGVNSSADITDIFYDGSRVVGGYDFVGDGWGGGALIGAGGSPYLTDPIYGAPGFSAWSFATGDNDPIDCNGANSGHGSHVAGTAAGNGVTDAGATYTGPYNSGISSLSWTIFPGIAPEASIYAMKIGDCASAVSFVASALAIDFAMDPNGDGNTSDRLDAISNSYGGAYGAPQEPLVQAFNDASAAGIVMAGSAGNEGNTFFVNGDPNIAGSAISTASSVTDETYSGLLVAGGTYGAGTVIPARSSQGGAAGTYGPMSLRLVGGGINNQGCAVGDYAGFAGEAGLIIWDASASGCGSGTRMTNAVAAGGVAGLVVVSADPGDFPFINLACTDGGGPSSIPCVSILGSDGSNLQASPGTFTVTFDSTLTATTSFSANDTLSGFSSRGPVIRGGTSMSILKPDITAPGDSIFSTLVGSGDQGQILGGTSMAGPHTTGAAALIRQLNPGWTPAQVKALLMNTATNDLFTGVDQTGDRYPVSRVGAGRLDIPNALNAGNVIAYAQDAPERVSQSYGLVEVMDTVSLSRQITVQNLGSTTQSYSVSFDTIDDINGVSYSVSPSSISVAPGTTMTVTVTLSANKANMNQPHQLDPTTPATQPTSYFGNRAREWIDEEAGYVVLTNTGSASDLRVPVHAIVRPVGDMQVSEFTYGPLDYGTTFMELAGDEVYTGTSTPNDIIGQVTVLENLLTHPVSLPGVLDSADIQYVGVGSDYMAWLAGTGDPTMAINNATIYIGIVTHGAFATPNGFDTWFDVGLDIDEDGLYDYTAFNFISGFFNGAEYTDTLETWIFTGDGFLLGSGSPLGIDTLNGFTPDVLDMYTMNNNVLVLAVPASFIGMTTGNTDLNFDIFGLSSFFNGDFVPDTAPFWFSYDLAAPQYAGNDLTGVAGGPYAGIPTWYDLDGNSLPVDYDFSATGTPAEMLVLHHHNGLGSAVGRAEVITPTFVSDADVLMVKTVDNETPSEGDTIFFDIEVLNDGPATAVDPIVVDTLPTGLTYVTDNCPGVSSTAAVAGGTEITCDMTGFQIPPDALVFYTVEATVDAGTDGTDLTNVVQLTSLNVANTGNDVANDTASVNVCVGGTPGDCNPAPAVTAVVENGGTSITNGAVLSGVSVNELVINFNGSVLAGSSADGADNADNYRLLKEGSTPGFETAACTDSIATTDAIVDFTVSYDPVSWATTLSITGPSPWPPLDNGQYRVMVCGSTSIINNSGIPLNGGSDTVIDFTIEDAVTEGGGGSGSGLPQPEDLGVEVLPSTGETPWLRNFFDLLIDVFLGE